MLRRSLGEASLFWQSLNAKALTRAAFTGTERTVTYRLQLSVRHLASLLLSVSSYLKFATGTAWGPTGGG